MEFPNKIIRELGGEKFEVIPYLTLSQIQSIAGGCIDIFDNGCKTEDGKIVTDIEDWDKSLILMERNFDAFLIETCTTLKNVDYDVAVANGVISLLYDEVINAKSTLDKIYHIIGKRDSLPYVVEKAIKKLMEKIPTPKELEKLYSTVKKDVASGKFNESIGKIKDIFDVNKKLGN